MIQVKRRTDLSLNLKCEDIEDKFVVRYTNRGDPFVEGISIGIVNKDFDKELTVMLGDFEAKKLRDLLNQHYPND